MEEILYHTSQSYTFGEVAPLVDDRAVERTASPNKSEIIWVTNALRGGKTIRFDGLPAKYLFVGLAVSATYIHQ